MILKGIKGLLNFYLSIYSLVYIIYFEYNVVVIGKYIIILKFNFDSFLLFLNCEF